MVQPLKSGQTKANERLWPGPVGTFGRGTRGTLGPNNFGISTRALLGHSALAHAKQSALSTLGGRPGRVGTLGPGPRETFGLSNFGTLGADNFGYTALALSQVRHSLEPATCLRS